MGAAAAQNRERQPPRIERGLGAAAAQNRERQPPRVELGVWERQPPRTERGASRIDMAGVRLGSGGPLGGLDG